MHAACASNNSFCQARLRECEPKSKREWDEKDFLLRSSSLTSMTEMPNPAGFYSFVMPRPPGTNCEARRSVSISTAIHLSKMLLRFLIKSPSAHARLLLCGCSYSLVTLTQYITLSLLYEVDFSNMINWSERNVETCFALGIEYDDYNIWLYAIRQIVIV